MWKKSISAMTNFRVTINICDATGCRNLFTAPCKTLKQAEEKYKRISTGKENYGHALHDPRKEAVILSLWKENEKIKSVQIN